MLHTVRASLRDRPGLASLTATGLLSLCTISMAAQTPRTPPASQPPPASQTPAPPQPSEAAHKIRIRILNAQTNKPVTNERLNVSLHTDQVGFTVMPTDKNGSILVDTGDATIIHILSNFYADCRPRGELYTNYPLTTIWSSGITTGNLCSAASPAPKPGDLLLFVIPKTYIPTMGQPPSSSFPHSDENPNLH